VSAASSYGYQSIVCDTSTISNVKALKTETVASYGKHGLIRQSFHSGDIESEEAAVPVHHPSDTQVCEFVAVGQCESLDSLAVGKRL